MKAAYRFWISGQSLRKQVSQEEDGDATGK